MDNASKSKFVFFGTPTVASETLEFLISNGYVPSLVITNPDAPRDRGQLLSPSPVKELATRNNLPVLTPEKLDEKTIEDIKAVGADYALVVAYGKILPEALINIFPLGILNVHYSLLPKYRGASPVEGALLNGETVTGVTIQKMVKEMDAGDIIAKRELPIDSKDTTVTLRPRLIMLGAELLLEVLPAYLNGEITPEPQDHGQATFSGKIKKTEGELDLSLPGQVNWNKYRAYAAWPGVYFFKDGKRIKVTAAHLSDSGEFVIDRVIPEGKKEVEYGVWVS